MTMNRFERMRTLLFGGHRQNAFAPLLKDRTGIGAPIQGSPEEFAQIVYELTQGELNRRNGNVSYVVIEKGNKDLLKFSDGSLFSIIKAKRAIGGHLIVITPYLQSMDDLLNTREVPISRLISTRLMIQEAYTHVATEYGIEERRRAAEKAAADARMSRESRLDTVLATIEKAGSGKRIMVRGQQNIDGLVDLGFVPCLVDNPDNWIDAEDFPGMRYRHARSGIEVLLIGREKFRPIEELSRMEYTFLVHRSDDDPAAFNRMVRKFRETTAEGTPYSLKAFHDDLITLVTYPEELKGRTEEDLGLIADEVEHVIDRRHELDKGLLPYEAVFRKDTDAIVEYIRKNNTPDSEIQKALDYFEYTGMIDPQYKTTLNQRIKAARTVRTEEAHGHGDVLYDKRVKEIVADVLRKIPRENLTSMSITIAMTPYVSELGFSKLIKIRERILQLKDMVHDQQDPLMSLGQT